MASWNIDERNVRFFTNTYPQPLIYQPKNFLIPDSELPETILYYISKNASSFVSQKLFNTCKYFSRNQKFAIFRNLTSWRTASAQTSVQAYDISFKIWLTGNIFRFATNGVKNPDIFRSLCYANIKRLEFHYQNLSYNEFLILVRSGNVTRFVVIRGEIKHRDGSWVPLGDIIEKLPLMELFD